MHEAKNVFRTSRQQLVPETFKMVENQSIDSEEAMADESVIYDVSDYSTAESSVIPEAFVYGQDGSGVGICDEIFCLVQMKLEEPDGKKNSSLKSEPQLVHSD